jgi:hypothetical protein
MFLWECMVLAFKVSLGGILWGIAGFIILSALGGIVKLLE